MPVPTFQEFMLPLMRYVAASGTSRTVDYYSAMADHFGLSEEDKQELIPSGPTPVYKNRIGWAITHLFKAGLLDRPARGTVQITDRGRDVLAGNPERIDLKFLDQYEDHRAFRTRNDSTGTDADDSLASAEDESSLDPEEQLRFNHRQLRSSLSDDLLTLIKSAPPSFFEQLVVDLLVRMGYGGTLEDAGQAIGKSGDGGIDGIIKEDRLGLDFVYIQAKRWENPVHAPEVRGFAGSLEERRARRGVFITTSTFSTGAKSFVNNIEKRIVLIDGAELANLMLDYGIGVTDVATYKVQRIDPTYFGED